jgi:hypothetical protein
VRRRGLAASGGGAALLLLLGVLVGCSGKPPVISRVYARVIYVHDAVTGADTETLGVFLVASDPDGMENLKSYYVINDDAELFWKVDDTSWSSTSAEGESWIGTSSLAMPGSAPVPPGRYRVVLQSAGGDTVEDGFTLPERDEQAAKAVYPSAAVTDGVIRISGPARNYEIWVYDKGGRFMASVPEPGKNPSASVKSIVAAANVPQGFAFRVFAWNEKAGYGVLAGPYTTPTLPGQ